MGNCQPRMHKTYVEEVKAKRGANAFISRSESFKNIYSSKKNVRKYNTNESILQPRRKPQKPLIKSIT